MKSTVQMVPTSSAGRFTIEVRDEQALVNLSPASLAQALEIVMDAEGVAAAAMSVMLVDDRRIHRINREYLNHDEPTDVISFLLDESPDAESMENAGCSETRSDPFAADGGPKSSRGRGKRIEGELVISTETAARVSANQSWTAAAEVLLYFIHGLLHLAGYDDLADDERPWMRRREQELLTACQRILPELQGNLPEWREDIVTDAVV